jgi:hypothetical protein
LREDIIPFEEMLNRGNDSNIASKILIRSLGKLSHEAIEELPEEFSDEETIKLNVSIANEKSDLERKSPMFLPRSPIRVSRNTNTIEPDQSSDPVGNQDRFKVNLNFSEFKKKSPDDQTEGTLSWLKLFEIITNLKK